MKNEAKEVRALGIPMIAMFGCGASSVTSNSRMCWSFSRDGGLPFGRYLSAVNKTCASEPCKVSDYILICQGL